MQTNQKYLAYGLLACLVVGGLWYVFCSADRYSNNTDARLSDLETKLSDVAAEQRKTSDAISTAKGTASDISDTAESIGAGLAEAQATVDRGAGENAAATDAVRSATATANECAASIEDSRKRFAECASIFDRIEQSNQSGTSSSGAKGNNP